VTRGALVLKERNKKLCGIETAVVLLKRGYSLDLVVLRVIFFILLSYAVNRLTLLGPPLQDVSNDYK